MTPPEPIFRSMRYTRLLALLLGLWVADQARAQSAPPLQYYVADIGAEPLKAAAPPISCSRRIATPSSPGCNSCSTTAPAACARPMGS